MYPQSLENVPVWDDRTWRTLAPQNSDLSAEVCVIGLGGSGLTAISELLDLGRRVVGIDADDVAAGAAGRNGGGRDKAFDEEWTTANEPTAFIQQYLESVLRKQLHVTAPITHRSAADVSYRLNGLPVLAELRPGTWVIGGYCGTGNAVGALCGRAAPRLASGDSSEFARLLVNAGTPETH